MIARALTALVLMTAATAPMAPSPSASCSGTGSASKKSFGGAIECVPPPGGGGSGNQQGGSGSPTTEYRYELACSGDWKESGRECPLGYSVKCAQQQGKLYRVFSRPVGQSEWIDEGLSCIRAGEPGAEGAPQVTPGQVLRAFRRIPLPASEISIQPPGGKTLVNLDTILSTRAEGFRRTITLLGQRVELVITPSSYRWVHGDGTEQVSTSPGRPYREGLPMDAYLTHSYTERSVAHVRVDTTWSATFRVNRGPVQPVGGTVTIEGDPTRLRVMEAPPRLEDPR